jgi:prepilin peptidase CpaA
VTAFELAAIGIGLLACVTDLRSRRVPNAVTFPAIVAGVATHTLATGASGAVHAALGCLAGGALFFPFFAIGGLGGGDVKLMAALGAWIGPGAALWTALYGACAGGVMAVAVALSHGYLRQAITNLGSLFLFWGVKGLRPMPGLTLEEGHGPRLPYAIPIFTGLLVTIWRH